MVKMKLRILMVEDSENDALLIMRRIKKDGLDPVYKRVDSKRGMIAALEDEKWDIVLSDYNMSGFNGLEALELFKEKDIDIPFILISGTVGEEIAVKTMKNGGSDYIMKDKLTRLVPSIKREIEEAKIRKENKEFLKERKRTSENLKTAYEELDRIFNTAADGLRIIDTNFNVLRVNMQFCKISGLNQKENLSKKCYESFPGQHCHISTCIVRQILNGAGKVEMEEEKVASNNRKVPCTITATPLNNTDGKIKGVVVNYKDVTEKKKAEKKLEKSYQKLQKTLNGTVNALSRTVEARDSYTSGHQKRVASLAKAISIEMKINEDQIHLVEMAAQIHDLGKVVIPASILSKPGKITELEFSLIKVHPQTGFDILKETEIPTHVANTILQHHERLDGSGYPKGIKGSDIITEARIIAVADVIEAMSSHRPYRPSLGIDKAIKEILKYRGEKYDPKVVDICVELFREKGFKFSDN